MSKHLPLVAALVNLAGLSLLAQPPDSLVASGYLLPTGAIVAPGQVLRLFVQEVGATLTGPVLATSLPLPTMLAGISILLQESHGRGLDDHFLTVPVPIFAVVPFSSCAGTVFERLPDNPAQQPHRCGSFVAITVQIPFEVQATEIGVPPDSLSHYGVELIISEAGVAKATVVMNTYQDRIHVITNCDTPLPTSQGSISDRDGLFFTCDGLIFHSDGTPAGNGQAGVSHIAHPGEQLVFYAVGLGSTTPAAKTGQPSPPGAAVPIQLGFDFIANARPRPSFYPPQTAHLVFAGLSPGSVGLYQINFTVPEPPPGAPSCFSPGVLSNLTVSISGVSFDGVAFCVAVK